MHPHANARFATPTIACMVAVGCGAHPAQPADPCAVSRPAPVSVSGHIGVEGAVIDADTGKPLDGVTVFTDPEAHGSVVTTDASGHFSIDLSVGSWTVAAALGGDRVTIPAVVTRPDARTRLTMYMRPNCVRGELTRRR